MKKGILRSLNDELITPRTHKKEVKGEFTVPPMSYLNFVFIYHPDEVIESPGVVVACELVENIDNFYRIIDTEGRRFELEVLNETIISK